MKDDKNEELVEELIFDEDGNDMQEEKIIYDKDGNEVGKITAGNGVEELSEEEKEKVTGGVTYSNKGTKYKTITLNWVGQSKLITAGLGWWDSLQITRGSGLISTGWFLGAIQIKRKSTAKGTATVKFYEYHEALTTGNYYYTVYVTVQCT